MIQMGTILEVADNSGAKKIACIHLKGALGQYGHLGDVITASVKEATPDGTVKKGQVATTSAQLGIRPISSRTTQMPPTVTRSWRRV